VSHVLITGGAGFIGSHLAESLLDRGDEVSVLDNFDPFYPRAIKESNLRACAGRPGFQLIDGDVRDRAGVAALLSPGVVVVHLAALAGVRPSVAAPERYADVNVGGTAALLAAMRDAGATRLVFASSSAVYGDDTPAPFREDAPAVAPVSPYGATKRAAELLVGAMAPLAGLRAAIVRLFTVYGPRQRPDLAIHAFARRMVGGEPITLFGSGQARDYTFVTDAVAGLLGALDWTGTATPGHPGCFNVGGNHPIPLETMASRLAHALGVTATIEHAPAQPGDVLWTAADLSHSGPVLGYRPRVPFADGLDRFVAWFRETYALAH
jgi:UDP-glucuronate 4-epimerase